MAISTGISFGTINSTLNRLVSSAEDSLNSQLTEISAKSDPTTTDMLSLQQGLQNWMTMIEMSNTTTKDFYDTLKSTVQKSS